MRFMVIVKADKDSEAGVMPSEELLTKMAKYKELVAGFWMWKAKSREEAIEWLKRAPFDGGTEVEIRRVFEAEDFAKATP